MIVSVLVLAGLEGVPHRELGSLSHDAITLRENGRRHRRRGASPKARGDARSERGGVYYLTLWPSPP